MFNVGTDWRKRNDVAEVTREIGSVEDMESISESEMC